MDVLDYQVISKYKIIVTYKNKVVKKLGIYHITNKSILCDDFETYIKLKG